MSDGVIVGEKISKDTNENKEIETNLEADNMQLGAKTVIAKGTNISINKDGGKAVILGKNITLDVAKTEESVNDSQQQEITSGEGIKLNSSNIQLGAITNTDSTEAKATTTNSVKGVTIKGGDLTILADMKDGTLKTIATDIDIGNKALILGGNSIIHDGVEETTTSIETSDVETTKVSLNMHHVAVDAVAAAEQVKEAGEAVKDATDAYKDAKTAYANGEITAEALSDHKANIAAAGVNLANAQINLGATATSVTAAVTAGFSLTGNAEQSTTHSETTDTQGTWKGTKIQSGSLKYIGDSVTGTGVSIDTGSLDLQINEISLSAGTNTSTNEGSSKTNTINGSISTSGSISGGLSNQESDFGGNTVKHSTSKINAGSITGDLDSLTLNGATITADSGNLNIDQLSITSVQDSSTSYNKSKGGNIGISTGYNEGSTTGLNIGGNSSKGNTSSSQVTEQSGINFGGSLTAKDTVLNGGSIANIQTDEQGISTAKPVDFTTDTLISTDLINTGTSSQTNKGVSLGGGGVGIQIGDSGKDTESVTRATLGEGVIVTSDKQTGNDSLAGVNRDVFNTEVITKEIVTGALAVDSSVDTRVFTKEGIKDILNEQENLGDNAKATGAVITTAGAMVPAAVVGLFDEGNNTDTGKNKSGIDKAIDNIRQLDNNLTTALNDDNAEIVAKEELISEGELTNSIDNQATYDELANNFAEGTEAGKRVQENGETGVSVNLVDDLTAVRNKEGVVLGSANVSNGTDMYLNNDTLDRSNGVIDSNGDKIVDASNTINVINHEIAHLNGQDEAAAATMGALGDFVYNVGKGANRGDIDKAKDGVNVTAINNTHSQKAQNDFLDDNKDKLEEQQDKGDVFEDTTSGGSYDGYWARRTPKSAREIQESIIKQKFPNNPEVQKAYLDAYDQEKKNKTQEIIGKTKEAFINSLQIEDQTFIERVATSHIIYMAYDEVQGIIDLAKTAKEVYITGKAFKEQKDNVYNQMIRTNDPSERARLAKVYGEMSGVESSYGQAGTAGAVILVLTRGKADKLGVTKAAFGVDIPRGQQVSGGAHRDTSKPVNDGFDSHHCPAKNCYKDVFSKYDGPAIKMDPNDHRKTASYGRSVSAIAYRERQKELLQQGKLKAAIQMDIDDIRLKFGNKYDDAIKQMENYADTLDPNDFINKK